MLRCAVTMPRAVAGAVILVVFCPPRICAKSYVAKAQNDVMTLQHVVLAYKERHAFWPENLQILGKPQADGGLHVVEEYLVDPWGRPYHFDPRQLHPETNTPLIWSDGPDPTNPDGRITNWPKPTSVWDAVLEVARSAKVHAAACGGSLGLIFVLARRFTKCPEDKWTSKTARAIEILVELAWCGLLAGVFALCTPTMLV
jgi:hypothetical protein